MTLLCGALPASALLLFTYSIVGQVLFGYLARPAHLQQTDPLAIVIGWSLIAFATAGTIGLWRVAIQREYFNRLNVVLLFAGLIAMLPVILPAIEQDPMWFIPFGADGDSHEALILLGPLYTGFAYLMVMARRRIGSNRGSERSGR